MNEVGGGTEGERGGWKEMRDVENVSAAGESRRKQVITVESLTSTARRPQVREGRNLGIEVTKQKIVLALIRGGKALKRETRQKRRGAREKAGSTTRGWRRSEEEEKRNIRDFQKTEVDDGETSREGKRGFWRDRSAYFACTKYNYRKRSWLVFHRKVGGRSSKTRFYETMLRWPESARATHGGGSSGKIWGSSRKSRTSLKTERKAEMG
ncbi:hypothetical protein R3P38DRAFT_3473949 [Favolaschia claudopus]|uniref:Uncharacterized protein n=1 Tax=Favolaschia claudopus TaxID=2862362 RepID=A0AAW0CDS0_9AGAR